MNRHARIAPTRKLLIASLLTLGGALQACAVDDGAADTSAQAPEIVASDDSGDTCAGDEETDFRAHASGLDAALEGKEAGATFVELDPQDGTIHRVLVRRSGVVANGALELSCAQSVSSATPNAWAIFVDTNADGSCSAGDLWWAGKSDYAWGAGFDMELDPSAARSATTEGCDRFFSSSTKT